MTVRRNNVEYYGGRKAERVGLRLEDNPYTKRDGDSRYNRWRFGWTEATQTTELLNKLGNSRAQYLRST